MSTRRKPNASPAEAVLRSGRVREIIGKLMNDGVARTSRDISKSIAPQTDPLGYDRRNAGYLLGTMVEAGILSMNGKDYVLTSHVEWEEPTPVSTRKQRISKSDVLQVDVVKATGRVRLSIQGLIIEIGVV